MTWDMWTPDLFNWPFSTTLEMWRQALEAGAGRVEAREEPQWATANRLALELPALRLRDFSSGEAKVPLVVVAPFALHDAQLADLAPDHSLMEALRRNGCGRLYLVDWKSATPATRLDTIDSQLASLNVAIDDIGPPVDIVGLCQGGWLSLLYAARFPAKTRRIVLAGAPIDVEAEASALTAPIRSTPDSAVDRLISRGDGILRGDQMATLWPREDSEERRLVDSLQLEPPFVSARARATVAAFRRWDRRPLDLPGPYFREVVGYLYRENRLARGGFPALGREIDLRAFLRPLFLLVGEKDPIAPPAQALAAIKLVGGPVDKALAPCGHLALFMGRATLRDQWPRVVQWLLA